MAIEWIGIFLYLCAQLCLGLWVSKKIRNKDDFFLAGRSIPLSLTTFSIFATWFGADTCIGASGAVFGHGLWASKAEPFGYTLCLVIMGVFFAKSLWKRNLTTLADLFRKRYSVTVERMVVWILVPSSIMWAAAQIRAFGQVLTSVSPLDLSTSIGVATTFVICYTFLGGILGDSITDFVQGIILILGLVFLLVMTIANVGGVQEAFNQIDFNKLTFSDPEQTILEQLDNWMVPIFGSLVAQELVARVLASKSPNVARNGNLLGAGMYLAVGLIPVFLGLVGNAFVAPLSDSERFLPLLAHQVLPTAVFVLFSGALISAILSTVDSALLAISALLANNFLYTIMKVKNEKQKLLMARGLIVIAGLASCTLALNSSGIHQLVEEASTFGSAGILVITLFGLFSQWGSTPPAIICLVTGLLVRPLYEDYLHLQAPFISTFLTCFIVFVGSEFTLRFISKRAEMLSANETQMHV